MFPLMLWERSSQNSDWEFLCICPNCNNNLKNKASHYITHPTFKQAFPLYIQDGRQHKQLGFSFEGWVKKKGFEIIPEIQERGIQTIL